MGCDIHVVVQIKKEGRWETLPGREDFFENRDYNAFAVLADVRNGSGFAGIKTGDGWIPISNPKGLPDDFDDESFNDWEMDTHSESFLTLREIMLYPHWAKSTKECGVIKRENYKEWKKYGDIWPKMWAGYVGGTDVKVIEEKDIDSTDEYTHVRASRDVPYTENAVYERFIPEMWIIAKQKDVRDDEVRIVFWFDN